MEQAGGALPRGEGRGDLGRRMAQRRRVELVDAGLPRVKALVAQLRTEFGRTRPAQLVAPLFQRASKAGTSAGSGRVQTWSLKGAACPDAERIPAAVLTRRSSRLRLLLSSAGATPQCRFARGAQATSADARRPPPSSLSTARRGPVLWRNGNVRDNGQARVRRHGRVEEVTSRRMGPTNAP